MSMKDFEWRKQYAPHGYHFVRKRVMFDVFERGTDPKMRLKNILEHMHMELAEDCPYFFDPLLAHTRVSVFPKEVGESVNHLDPLKPRFGIEIEIRQPMPADIARHISGLPPLAGVYGLPAVRPTAVETSPLTAPVRKNN